MQTVVSRIGDVLAQMGTSVHYVPGGSLDPFLDALYQNSGVKIYCETNEGAVSCAALGDSFRTGLGVAVVTQGAGLAAADDLSQQACADELCSLLDVRGTGVGSGSRNGCRFSID